MTYLIVAILTLLQLVFAFPLAHDGIFFILLPGYIITLGSMGQWSSWLIALACMGMLSWFQGFSWLELGLTIGFSIMGFIIATRWIHYEATWLMGVMFLVLTFGYVLILESTIHHFSILITLKSWAISLSGWFVAQTTRRWLQ